MLFECVCVQLASRYTPICLAANRCISIASARPKEHTSLSINYSLYINSDLELISLQVRAKLIRAIFVVNLWGLIQARGYEHAPDELRAGAALRAERAL